MRVCCSEDEGPIGDVEPDGGRWCFLDTRVSFSTVGEVWSSPFADLQAQLSSRLGRQLGWRMGSEAE